LLFLLNEPPPTAFYTLSLHDALPIFRVHIRDNRVLADGFFLPRELRQFFSKRIGDNILFGPYFRSAQIPLHRCLQQPILRLRHRSEEHTSELQSREKLVCRLLLEKKK